jgi:hypothetical protein
MCVRALNTPRYTSTMPIQTVFKAEIERISILDEHCEFDEKLGAGLIPDEDLVRLYEAMSSCRYLDEVAFKLQRSGRMGTYPQNMGQEATSLGAAYALNGDDWLVTCYRENCGLFWRGVPMESILLHWMGDERGNAMPAAHYATPIAVPIGTQMLHATGLAWASKYRGESRIACTFFGDGASSEGDFHEAANFAANLDIPVNGRAARYRLRHALSAGRWERHLCLRLRGQGRRQACTRIIASNVHRTGHLPPWRSHHSRRRAPLPRSGGSRSVEASRSTDPNSEAAGDQATLGFLAGGRDAPTHRSQCERRCHARGGDRRTTHERCL